MKIDTAKREEAIKHNKTTQINFNKFIKLKPETIGKYLINYQ